MSIFYQYAICFLKDLLFLFQIMHSVCVCACEFECLQSQEEGIRSSRAVVTDGYELLNMGDRSQT